MNVERIFADADLSRGLAAAALPTDTSEFDAINEKLNTLTTAKAAKLDTLMPQAVANPFAPETEDAVIVGMEDADTAILANGTKVRVSDPLRRYDAAEVKHEYDGVLPEMIANVLPSWVPGTGTNHKSSYSSDKQREQAALVLGKRIGDVTTKDVYDVGNMQQVQVLADLTRGKDQERFVADVNPGGEYINLNDPNSPLNIPIKINKNRTKDVHGRDLTPLYNAETGENVTAMHAADPRLNAFAPGVPEPAQFSVGNIAKGAASGAIQIAGGLADTVTSAGAVAVDAVTAAIGKPEWYTDQDRAIATGFFDKYKDAKWANGVTGYDPKYNEQQLGKALDSMKNGNYIQGIGQALTAGPGTLMDSAAYMALLTTGAGTVGMIASEVNDSIEEFSKNNKGAEPSAAQLARIVALDSVKVLLEKLPFVKAIKGKAATLEAIKSLSGALPEGTKRAVMAAAMSRAGTVAVNMVEEGAQEGTQGVIDYYNREYGTAVDKGMNTDEIYKSMLGGAGAGGATGIVGQGVDALSGAKSLLPSKKEKAAETAAAVPTMTDEVPDYERKHMFDTLEAFDDDSYDFTNNTKDVLDNFYRAEDTFNRLAAVSKDPAAVKEFGAQIERVRSRILSTVDNIDDNAPFLLKNEGEFKLGSAEDMVGGTGNAVAAEELIEFVLENSPSLSKQREAKLLKVAADNGVELAKFNELKGYYEVEAEAVEGKRGYRGYERALKALSATDTPNVRALDKAVKNAQEFLRSQANAVHDFEAGIREAENRANQANSPQNITKTTPERVKVVTPQKVKNFEFTINYAGELGNLTVHPSAYKVLKAKQRNVAGITNALATVSKYVKNKGLDVDTGTSVGIVVPQGVKEAAQKYRKNDQAFYDRVGATKVILDTTVAKQEGKVSKKTSAYNKWDRDYRALNMSKINTGTYTKDDVVVINAKTGKDRQFVDAKVIKEVEAAMKAGATLVIDNDIIRRDLKNYKNIVLQLGRFTKPSNKYARVLTNEGKVAGSYVFKPAAIATKMNEEILAKAKVTKEAKTAEKKAKDALILAFAAYKLDSTNKETKIELDAAKKAVVGYFKDSKDGSTAEENAMKYAERVLEEEIEAGAEVVVAEMKEYEVDFNDSEDIAGFIGTWGTDEIVLPKGSSRSKITSAAIVKLALDRAVAIATRSAGAVTLFKEWKQHLEDLKSGKTTETIDQWLKSKMYEGKEALDLKNTLSAGLGRIYVKTEEKSKEVTNTETGEKELKAGHKATSYSKDPGKLKNAGKGMTLDLDLQEFMSVSNTTVLNTVSIDDLSNALPAFDKEVEDAVVRIEKLLDVAKLTDDKAEKRANGTAHELTPQEFALVDGPGQALLFDNDGKINKTVVAAIVLSLHNAYKNSGYMLSSKTKSMDDIERMLGGTRVSFAAAKVLSEKGMFTKSLATNIRKDFASKLGITRNKDSIEDKRFDQAMTDIAQIAIALGVDTGVLKYDEMTVAEYKSTVLGEKLQADTAGRDKNTLISFIKLTDDDVLDDVTLYDEVAEVLPLEDVYRVEPEFYKPSAKDIEARLERVRNEKLGTQIPKDSKKLMVKAMNAEHYADTSRIVDIMQYKDAIKAKMGYIELDSDEYAALSMDKKDIQEAINRDVDKEIDELLKLVDRDTGTGDDKKQPSKLSLWFMVDFIKNGRYMYDSNTINPQTQKQLTRWLVYPKDHEKTVTYSNNKFMIDGKNVTAQYMVALGQALGFPVDKKNIRNTTKFVQSILAELMNEKNTQLDTLFADMLKGKVEVGGLHVEIEHIAHAHQAIQLLKDLKANGTATSSLTAEIDAKTSGFGIKSALMPITEFIKAHLRAVGIDIGSATEDAKAVTEYLDNDTGDNMPDMYQSLGGSMKQVPLNIADDKTKSAIDGHTASKLGNRFNKVHLFLSETKIGDMVGKDIRDLFKQPFMEFNYSASLATIRASLALSMAHKAAELAMKDADKFKELGFAGITGMTHAEFAATMRETRLNQIEVNNHNKAKLESQLAAAMDLIYGAQVEAAFIAQFEPAIRAQGVINQAYQVMFKQYKKVYDLKLAELRYGDVVTVGKDKGQKKEKGAVSVGQYRALLDELRDMFPTIRSPLAEGIDENVAIYSTDTVTADSIETGTRASQIALNKDFTKKHGKVSLFTGDGTESSTLQYEIKQFEEAMSAGSVVPIHYFDGSLMALTGIADGIGDLTMIHDAIMPPIDQLFTVAKEYNKNLYELSLGSKAYALVSELKKSLERVTELVAKTPKVDLGNKITTVVRTFNYDITNPPKATEIALKDLVALALTELTLLETEVNTKRTELQNKIAKYGVNVSNLVTGDNEGSYVTGGKAKAETKVEDDTIQEDNKDKIFTALQALLGKSGKKELDRLATMMKDC